MTGTRVKSWQTFWVVLLSGLTLFLSLYNLEYYPPTWYDEGIHLLVAKALALRGLYGFGPAVGPTVFLPVATAFRLAGVGLLSARLAMVAYLLLGVAAFSALARHVGGWKVAVVATLLLLSSPGANLLRWGRQVIGEVPATLFLLLGVLVWLRTARLPVAPPRYGRLTLSGLLLGLAILTKNQFALLLPAWVLVWLADRVYYRQLRHVHFVLPLVGSILVPVAWYVGQRFLFPVGELLASHNAQEWSSSLSRGLFTLNAQRMLDALRLLTSQDAYYAWLLPALLYALFLSLRRSKEGLGWALLTSLSTVWLGWFLVLSVGWPRYAFLPLMVGALLVARLFHDLTDGFHLPAMGLSGTADRKWDASAIGRVALLALLLIIILRPLQGRITEVISGGDPTPQEMAAYIVEHVAPQDQIETYDPEVCFLSDHSCRYPPSGIMNVAIKYAWYHGPAPSEVHDFREHGAPYLLIGDFGRWVHVYDPQVVAANYELVTSIGTYELYREKPNE